MKTRVDGDRLAPEGDSRIRLAGIIALALSLVVGSAASFSAEADADKTPEAEDSADGSSGDEYSKDASQIVEDLIRDWLEDGPGRALREREELNVVQGVSEVGITTDNQRWSKARSLAFQNAFVQAMGEYVASVRQETTVSLARDYLAEDIPASELEYKEGEPPDSYMERIVLKSAVLTERTLDGKLAESGLSDEEIRNLTPVQKRTELAESISRNALTTAIGSAAGLRPVKTFEGLDDEGNSAIGVVAVYSERFRHIANQIAKGEVIRPDPTRARDSIMDQIDSYATDELAHEFGPRVMWDDQGYPAVVSFGQWGWSPANLSKKKRARRRKFAMKQAESDALSHLTVFIRASTRFTDQSTVGTDIEEAYNLPRGGVPEEVDVTRITDRLVETARIKAKVALTGYTQVKSWSAPHPLLDDQQLVGVVAYWSPAREDQIRKTIGKEAKHAPPEKDSSKKKKSVTGSGASRDPDLADF